MTRTSHRRPEHRGGPRAALALILAVTLTACGNLTAGGLGEATVLVSGDAPDALAQLSRTLVHRPGRGGLTPQAGSSVGVAGPSVAPGPRPGGVPLPVEGGGDPKGEVEAELSVFLVAEDGDLVPITDGDVRVRVDLDGVEEPELASRTVTAASYTGLRMVFVEIEADVDEGLVIDGQPVVGRVDVEIEDPLTVTKPLSIEVAEGASVELLIDLNAEQWLQAVVPATRTVHAQTFADLVSVTVR